MLYQIEYICLPNLHVMKDLPYEAWIHLFFEVASQKRGH